LGEGLTFMTAPLTEEVEICGHVVLELAVSSSTTDADLFLVLGAMDPDGKQVLFSGTGDPHTPPAQGWLRASHRKLDPALSLPHRPYHAHDEVQPLDPGQIYPLNIEIWPTSLIVPAGYRIVLNVLGRDFDYGGPGVPMSNFVQPMRGCGPCLHDDPEDRPEAIYGGVTTVHTGGAHRSALRLPLLKGAKALG
jgi:predicted acyl esterase